MRNSLLSRIFNELSKHNSFNSKMDENEICVMTNNKIFFVVNNVGCIRTIHSRNDDLFYLLFDTIAKIRAEIQSENFDSCKLR